MSEQTNTSSPKPNRPEWEARKTHPKLAEQAEKALRTVVDPELGMDVVTLGLIRNLQIFDESANLVMILTTPFCPYGPAILEAARRKVEEALQKPTTIELGEEIWERDMMEEGAAEMLGLW
ncbi:MAG TPA: DUF59 domain-containing protein [Chloroflexi bacterium]|nr:DUF59 domain-containing protein [Chloroflexota bacterium]